MKAREIMHKDPVCCTPSTPVQRVAVDMLEQDAGCIPVVKSQDDRTLVGVITDRDIALRVVAQNRDCVRTPVGEVMTSDNLHTVRPDDSAETAVDLMRQAQVRRIIVVDGNNRVEGIISMARLTRHLRDDGLLTDTLKGVTAPTALPRAA